MSKRTNSRDTSADRTETLLLKPAVAFPSRLRKERVLPWFLVVLASCDSTLSTSVVMLDNPQLVLEATRDYGPPTSWEDAEVELEEPVTFALPDKIPVLFGNSGNHWTTLSFRDAAGQIVECRYRGGSSEPHPDDEIELALARHYVFERCSNGATAGTLVETSWLELHVQLGDQKDPAGRTTVQLRLGESFPALDPPIPPAESIAIRDAFSWQSTQALPEVNAEGLPALYYAIIYVEDQDQREALYELMIHHDPLPFFGEELERWSGQRGTFEHLGDGTGIFVFAFIPGITYNLLREAALDGNEIFRVIELRDIPEAARGEDGSISYAALRDSGFLYLDGEPLPPEDPGDGEEDEDAGDAEIRPALFNSIKRRVIRAIAGAVRAVVVGVQQGIGFIDRTIGGSVTLTVQLDLRNTDPAFGGRLAQGTSTPMQRTWGTRSGEQVRLPDVRVTARQFTALGLIPTLFLDRTGDDGAARMKVARERTTYLCLDVKNDAAEITKLILPLQVCDFASIGASDLRNDHRQVLEIQNGDFNILAQATEGYEYMRDVVGVTPRKAIILVGFWANVINPNRSAIAPCFGFFNPTYDIAVEIVKLLLPVPTPPGWLYAVDIIMPNAQWGDYDRKRDSRVIPSHEYGHFALCTLLRNEGLDNIMIAYADVIVSRITGTNGGNNNPPADHEAAYINEAFADFIAEQIAGGKNYVEFGIHRQTAFHEESPSGGVTNTYCYSDVDACRCIDRNEWNTAPFGNQVERVFSILHDGFDGGARNGLDPSGWSVWRRDPQGFELVYDPDVRHTGDANDEEIRLIGPHLREIIARWDERANVLREDNFLGALDDVMENAGYTWCQRCQQFAIHVQDPNAGGIPADVFDICRRAPIDDWIGAPPAGVTSCPIACDDGNPCTTDTMATNNGCLRCNHVPAPATTICRAASGVCDAPELCTGTTMDCPADALQAAGVECRGAAGACDAPETCTGSSTMCPADAVRPSGYTCRGAAGACDVAETCTGSSTTCPADALRPGGYTCRGVAGVCDVTETCTGASAACPGDAYQPSGSVCRASSASCDPAETCTGTSTGCPQDQNMCQSCTGTPVSQVPIMTSNTAPSGTVSRSGVYDAEYEAWQAFDSNSGSMWLSETWQDPAWIAYEWADGTRHIRRYAITFSNGTLTSRAPRDWTLQGWTGSSWVVVDTRSSQTNWAGVETRTYDVASPGSYAKYRLHVTDDNDSRANVVVVSIGRLDLMGCR